MITEICDGGNGNYVRRRGFEDFGDKFRDCWVKWKNKVLKTAEKNFGFTCLGQILLV